MGHAPGDRIVIDSLVALGFGASLISIFARLGGGIFTKGADVGADLVGKVEAGIPEDDPRNPATIADNVGDNVGDCAGMAADLFETYAVTVVATMVLGSIFFAGTATLLPSMIYPLAICGVCILTSIVGAYFVKLGANNSIMGALYKGLIVTGLLSIVGLAIATTLVIGWGEIGVVAGKSVTGSNLFVCGIVGLIITGADRRHHRVLHRHRQAPGRVDRAGLRHRPRHQRHPGPRGVAGIDGAAGDRHRRRHHRDLPARRPLRHGDRGDDDARPRRHDRRARRLRPGHRQRRRHRRNGGPAEGSAPVDRRARRGRQHDQGGHQGLRDRFGGPRRAGAVRRLFQRPRPISPRTPDKFPYFKDVHVSFDLSNPYVVAGLIFGGLIPYLFGGIAMTAVGRAAGSVVVEVRRQFKEMPGIMQGTQRPDYGRAVDMLTKAAIREMIIPSLLPVLAPFVVYFGVLAISGTKGNAFAALGASLLGVIVNGLFVAISMTSGGGAWDNAKKSFEDGFVDKDGVKHFKGSDAHKASVTGDTVGDPYKDTAGPAVNPAIKITNIVALLLLAILAH